jgi:dCTP deaminase
MEENPGEVRPFQALNIFPYSQEQINPNSYNVRLGSTLATYDDNVYNWFLQTHGDNVPDVCCEDSKGKSLIEDLCASLGVHDAQEALEKKSKGDGEYIPLRVMDTKKEPEITNIEIPPEGLVLYPGILYLGHTVERTKCHGLVPVLEGRSSVARCGIQVHMTAGFGDNGFDGQWTLEIQVAFPVRIYAGCQIAQISFHPITGRHGPFYEGKYQGQQGPKKSGWWKDNIKLGKPNDQTLDQ